MKKLLFILLFIPLVFSCNSGELETANIKIAQLNVVIAQLKNDNEMLRKELDGYKYAPDKVCANVESLYESGNLEALRDIESVLKKYHPECEELKDVQKKCDKIYADRKAKEAALEKQRMAAVNKLRKVYDDVSGVTWYYNPYFTHYNNTNRTSVYIGKSGYSTWLRLKMSYEGDNWIFFDYAFLSYDGNTLQIPFDEYKDKKSDNSVRVWEWIDVSVDSYLEQFLREMVKGKSVKMRLTGKYTYTRNLTSTEKKAIQEVLMAYDILKNQK